MSTIADGDRATLVRMVRIMFPHEAFPAGPYERTADAVIEAAAGTPRLAAQLVQGLVDLDAMREQRFTELSADTALTVLRAIQETPFFRGVFDVAVVKLYSDPEVWELLGYEGPSFDKGGYVDRGFNDLDWLPEPRIELPDDPQEARA
jgi:hypothetical protein